MEEEGLLHLDEASARQLVLVRAIDDVDTQGKLLSAIEREQLEAEALAASRRGAGGVDFDRYLQERARRVLAAVENRNPRLAALQDGEAWRGWLMAALPLAACVLGAAIDRIDNPQQVNMLSPPLLGVVGWNLLVYLLLVLGAVLPGAWNPQVPLAALQRRIAGVPVHGRRTGRLRTDVLASFHRHWQQAAGAQQALWWKQLLHLAAAGWAFGLAFSIVLGGVVRAYRVGWESTLLDLGQVHAFLSALFAPVVLLLPFEPFTAADLGRMAFGAGGAAGTAEAARWVWMYVALLGLLVVLPRVLLAAWAAWRRRRLARAVRIDLRDPYFAQVLARVSPARITLGLVGAGEGRAAWARMLRELADHAPPRAAGAWTVLATAKGDALRVFEVPADFVPPEPVASPQAGTPPQAWLHDLVGRFRAPSRAPGRDAVQTTLAEADLLVLLADDVDAVQAGARLLQWMARPALVLVPGDTDRFGEAARRLGLVADVIGRDASMGHWLRDGVLLQEIAARLAPGQRAGFDRLAATWKDRVAARFSEAMRLVAAELVRAARDAEAAGSAPVGLRQLVNAGERDAAQRAREGARGALLQRLQAGEAALVAELVQLHRAGAPLVPVPVLRTDGGFDEPLAVDSPQAGMAGAATGAAMGAGIDLLTGGLTLGAATALGAVIGGGAAYAAAAWRNRNAPSGQPQVQLGDELLVTLAENLLVAYLVVAHRVLPRGREDAHVAWRSEAVAAVATRRTALEAAWQQARQASDPAPAVATLARELEGLARGLLERA